MNRFRILVVGALAMFSATPALAQMTAGVICNPKSQVTNARSGPTAKETSVVDKLANNTAVKILDRVKNPEGTHEWLKVEFKHSGSGATTTGYVYHEGVSASCGVQSAGTPPAVANVQPTPAAAPVWVPVGPNAPVLNAGNYPPIKFARELAPDEKLWPLCPRKGGECGYVDKQGKWVLEPRFGSASFFSEGVAWVKMGSKYGFIDHSGKWIAEPVFESVAFISEGFVCIKMAGKWGYIDRAGKWLVEPRFDTCGSFTEGLAFAGGGSKFGYIDTSGKWAIEPRFEGVSSFSEGLASVMLNGKYGYINRSGKIVVEPIYSSTGGLSEGMAWVKLAGKEGYIDGAGKMVIEPRFDSAYGFSAGLAEVQMSGKSGFIDKSGKWVVEPRFDGASAFSDGLAAVKISGKYGFIDTSGKWAIEPRFDSVGSFSGGVASAALAGKYGAIDTSGKWIVEPKYDDLFNQNGLFQVTFGARIGYLDLAGKPLTFSSEDFMMGVMEGNQKRMEEELKKKQDEIEKLKAQAAQAAQVAQQQPSRPSAPGGRSAGSRVFLCKGRGDCCEAVIILPGDAKSKIEFSRSCYPGGLLSPESYRAGQQQWFDNGVFHDRPL